MNSYQLKCKKHQNQTPYICLHNTCITTHQNLLCPECLRDHDSYHLNQKFILNINEFFRDDIDIKEFLNEHAKIQEEQFLNLEDSFIEVDKRIEIMFENLKNSMIQIINNMKQHVKKTISGMLSNKLKDEFSIANILDFYENVLKYTKKDQMNITKSPNSKNYKKDERPRSQAENSLKMTTDKKYDFNRLDELCKTYILTSEELEDIKYKQQFIRISDNKLNDLKKHIESSVNNELGNLFYVDLLYNTDLIKNVKNLQDLQYVMSETCNCLNVEMKYAGKKDDLIQQMEPTLKELAYLKHFYIDLTGNCITDDGVFLLSDIINNYKFLSFLVIDISWGQNKVSDKGIVKLASVLEKLQRLKVLRLGFYMGNHCITDTGMSPLLKMIDKLPNLDTMWLIFQGGDNSLTNKSMILLSSIIKNKSKLKDIRLNFAGGDSLINDEGFLTVVEALSLREKLETVELFFFGGKNKISDKSIKYLASQLYKWPELRALRLWLYEGYHRVTDDGFKTLIDTLITIFRLEKLELFFQAGNNKIGKDSEWYMHKQFKTFLPKLEYNVKLTHTS